VVWPWREAADDPSPAAPRRAEVLARFAVAAAVSLALVFGLGALIPGAVAGGVAIFIAVSGLWAPPLYRGFGRAMGRFAAAVGCALTWALLVPFFYLVIVPARIALGLRGKDPMQRRFPSGERTCWTSCGAAGQRRDYRKQY